MRNKKDYYNVLKPCPKCGSINIAAIEWKTLWFRTRFAIECSKCDFRIESRLFKRAVIKKWGIKI